MSERVTLEEAQAEWRIEARAMQEEIARLERLVRALERAMGDLKNDVSDLERRVR